MSETIFVKTRHHYKPYDDYFRLAALSGFASCYEDEIQYDSGNTYIVNHFAALGLNPRKTTQNAQIILWQTEHTAQNRNHIVGVVLTPVLGRMLRLAVPTEVHTEYLIARGEKWYEQIVGL